MRRPSTPDPPTSRRPASISFAANQLTRSAPVATLVGVRRILLLALLPLVLGAPSTASGEVPRLVATVGPGFTIDLADADGRHVNRILAGTYELLVHDLSAEHNFALGSKTTQQRIAETTVEFVGDQTFTIELPVGSYGYACSPHWQIMNGSFVTYLPTPPPPPDTVKPLSAKVTSAGVSLSARSVAPGKFRLTVVDRSARKNFHLVGPGVNRKTGTSFTGRVTWSVELAAGTYRFGSDPRLSGRLAVRALLP
jgi:hypothetical protein